MMTPRYRLWQLWQQLRHAPLSLAAEAEVEATLSATERVLFARLTPSDQWHSYRVFCALRAVNGANEALLKAALLHDVGKTVVPLTLWDRIGIVLLGRLLPRRAVVWGKPASGDDWLPGDERPLGVARWRRPFVVKERHPAWGAALAEAAGSSAVVVSLIRRHQDGLPHRPVSAEDLLLARLQWADDQN